MPDPDSDAIARHDAELLRCDDPWADEEYDDEECDQPGYDDHGWDY